MKCTNSNCLPDYHGSDIDNVYDTIIKVLSESSEKLVKINILVEHSHLAGMTK